jgi:hypothetical protein
VLYPWKHSFFGLLPHFAPIKYYYSNPKFDDQLINKFICRVVVIASAWVNYIGNLDALVLSPCCGIIMMTATNLCNRCAATDGEII